MRFCAHCGAEMLDEAAVCVHCGCETNERSAAKKKDDTMKMLVKIFLIIGCISVGWTLIPLAWCIPMTVVTFKKLKAGEALSTGFKVCILLFVSIVAGICLLCMDDI